MSKIEPQAPKQCNILRQRLPLLRRLIVPATVLVVLSTFARAQPQQILMRSVRMGVVSGRLVNTMGFGFAGGATSTTAGDVRERVVFRGLNGAGSIMYERTAPEGQLTIDIGSDGQCSINRTVKNVPAANKPDKDKPAPLSLEFTQTPGEPITLSIGDKPERKVYKAKTLWHLWVVETDVCREQLLPLLELIRPQWTIPQTATAVENELVKLAKVGALPERERWAALVRQLGDDSFTKREAADRALRDAGSSILPYLQTLDANQLDAEQQFRIRRILASLVRQTTEDIPEQIVGWLADDPAVWLALLGRPDEATRRAAATRLTALLGEEPGIDPAVDPAKQAAGFQRLRGKIERLKKTR
ncbi:MAG: hypothetical protein ABSG68_20615 [Thermoguttaceae bacterium]